MNQWFHRELDSCTGDKTNDRDEADMEVKEIEVSDDERNGHSDVDEQELCNGESREGLSPEVRELAHIAAMCLREIPYNSGVPKQVMHSKIETFGSTKLKQFWQEKSKLLSVSRKGYVSAVRPMKRMLFRVYRDRLLATMLVKKKAGFNARNAEEGKVNLVKGAGMFGMNSAKKMEEFMRLQLAPEWRELTHIAAKCLDETPVAYGNVSWQLINDRIATFGSARLKKFWQTKSKSASIHRDGYPYAVPTIKRKLFRQYRDMLSATIVAEKKAGVSGINVGEGKIDEGKGAAMFGGVALEMPIDPWKEMEESTSSQLAPEWVELAHVAAKCLYETPGARGKAARQIVDDRITTSGSTSLKQFWQTKSKFRSVIRDGCAFAVPKTRRELFRDYRDKLLATMIAESEADVKDTNVEEDKVNLVKRASMLGGVEPEMHIDSANKTKEYQRLHRDKLLAAMIADRKANVNDMSVEEGKVNNVKSAGMFGAEPEMHIDSGKEMEESLSLQLVPEWVELAHIAATCIFERQNRNGGASMKIINDSVGTLTPSYADVVRSTDGSVASQ
jgi:hypothetical protein